MSYIGINIIIKAISQTIPTYTMSVFKFLKKKRGRFASLAGKKLGQNKSKEEFDLRKIEYFH